MAACILATLRSGIGLATDLYDLAVINSIRPILEDAEGPLSDNMNGLISSATSVGAIVGQLGFGRLADLIGRRKTFIATATILFLGALGSSLAVPIGPLSVYDVLLVCRFFLGIGIGGEYPLSSAVTAETANEGKSAKSMATTYFMFQVGQLMAPGVVIVLIAADVAPGIAWRLSLGVGALMALFGALLRLGTMQESQAWLDSRMREHLFRDSANFKAVAWPLFGTVATWFIYDVVSWGVGSYTSSIFASHAEDKKTQRLMTLVYTEITYLMATPGFLLCFFMDRFGRKNYQLIGFAGMALCFFTIGSLQGTQLGEQVPLLVTIFGFQKVFESFGPGATTYIIPGEIFPTAVRGQCHGTSAAAGKLGAFIGQYLFPFVTRLVQEQGTFIVGGILLLVGFALTLVFTPSYDEATLVNLKQATRTDISRTTRILWGSSLGATDFQERVDGDLALSFRGGAGETGRDEGPISRAMQKNESA